MARERIDFCIKNFKDKCLYIYDNNIIYKIFRKIEFSNILEYNINTNKG